MIPQEAIKALRAAVAMKEIEPAIEFISNCEEFSKLEQKLLINGILVLSRSRAA